MIPLGLGGVVQLTAKAVSLASIHRCGHTGGPGTAGVGHHVLYENGESEIK